MIKMRSIIFGKKRKPILASAFLAMALGSFAFANQIFTSVDIGPSLATRHNGAGTTSQDLDKASAEEVPPPDKNSTDKKAGQTSDENKVQGAVIEYDSSTPAPTPSSPNSSAKTYTVKYDKHCFNLPLLTVNRYDAVKFMNNSSRSFWPASNDHPLHLLYPEFDAKRGISSGGSYSFTFKKVGVWGYHDHLHPSCMGVVTVK